MVFGFLVFTFGRLGFYKVFDSPNSSSNPNPNPNPSSNPNSNPNPNPNSNPNRLKLWLWSLAVTMIDSIKPSHQDVECVYFMLQLRNYGRVMVSSRDIPARTLILQHSPPIAALAYESDSNHADTSNYHLHRHEVDVISQSNVSGYKYKGRSSILAARMFYSLSTSFHSNKCIANLYPRQFIDEMSLDNDRSSGCEAAATIALTIATSNPSLSRSE